MMIVMCCRHLEAPAQQGGSTPLAARDSSCITGFPSRTQFGPCMHEAPDLNMTCMQEA